MPPSFNREGIDAAKEVRKRHPGTGVVILSQYDDPEYAVSLLAEGSAGYGYLLKDHIAEGDQLIEAIRAVATGGKSLRVRVQRGKEVESTLALGGFLRLGGARVRRQRGQIDAQLTGDPSRDRRGLDAARRRLLCVRSALRGRRRRG